MAKAAAIALRIIGLAASVAALLLLVVSFAHPADGLLSASFERAYFYSLRSGMLRLWTQEITPAPPTSFDLRLTTPGKMEVVAVDPGGTGRSRATNYCPPLEGWHGFWNDSIVGSATVTSGSTSFPLMFRVRRLAVPLLAVVAVGLIPIGGRLLYVRWRGLRSVSRRRRGLCPKCGYDVRASPERCPECGTDKAG